MQDLDDDDLYDEDEDYYDDDDGYGDHDMEEDAPKQAAQFVNGKLVNKGLDATIAKLSQLSLEVRKVVGNSFSDAEITDALKSSGNDVSQAINFIFDKTKSGKHLSYVCFRPSFFISRCSCALFQLRSAFQKGFEASASLGWILETFDKCDEYLFTGPSYVLQRTWTPQASTPKARDTSKLSGRLDALLGSKKSKPEKAPTLVANPPSLGIPPGLMLPSQVPRTKGIPLLGSKLQTSSTSDVLKQALSEFSKPSVSSTKTNTKQLYRDTPTTPISKPILNSSTPLQPKLAKSSLTDKSMSEVLASPWATSRSLLRAPSSFASFWISTLSASKKKTKISEIVAIPLNIGATTDAKSDVSPFQFNSPSPDDIVFNARSAKDKGKTTAIKSKPISSEPAVATKPKETVTFVAPKPRPAKEARIDIEAEMKARSAGKPLLNLVVVGHVDAGKSTIMGHLLFLLGEVDGRTMQKYERDAEKMKKSSFAFAWVLDATEEERSRGVTIDVAISKFETPSRKFTLLDAPGHRDFVPNMISGAAQADVALLVVDSTTGEFETGFDAGGQTREHALLVRSLGVTQIAVAVNKLDNCNWEESRFLEIQQKLQNFLVQAGFRRDKVTFVPCSGFTGENLQKRQSALLEKWYTGKTLVEVLDALETPPRPFDKPFRLPISDYFKGGLSVGSSANVSVQGRIESGVVKVGDQIFIMPLGEECTVKAIEILDDPVKWAAAGDNVSLSIAGVDLNQICVGNILCEKARPIPVTSHFRAKIVTFDIKIPLTIGVPVVLHHFSLTEPGTISKLVSTLDRSTGDVVKKNPRALPKNTTAVVEIKLDRPICIETSKDSKELGRFMLRLGHTVVAAGIVSDIISRTK